MSLSELLAVADPAAPRTLAGLIARFDRLKLLASARAADGRAIDPAGLGETRVRGVVHDSRNVRPGNLFVAIRGERADGHDFLPAAEAAGAAAAIVERPAISLAIPQLVVERARPSLAHAAAWWYGDPSAELAVVGITGTDGKTTTSFLAVAALEAAGLSSGLVGTVETKVGGEREPNSEHGTTPEAPELQRHLRAMVAAGNAAAVVETTSHGLALDRVAGIQYRAAILTNLTHEHLELHGTWEAYRDAKLSLFERLAGTPRTGRPVAAIVNADDPSAGLFVGVSQEAQARVLTYGTDAAAEVRATRVEEGSSGLRITYATERGEGRLRLRLAGRFNVHNALAVVALGEGWGLDREAVTAGLESVDRVPGRMERIDMGQPFDVVIDFAHSPASLGLVLDELAPLAAARGGGLVAVFGSAGERDTEKRSVMGRIAGERCRLVVVTDEDPRGEDSRTILEEIGRGAEAAGRRRGHDLLVIADRRAAIEAAFERARPGDVVLLAGKGHEQTIEGPDGPAPWNERLVAVEALEALGYAGAAGRA